MYLLIDAETRHIAIDSPYPFDAVPDGHEVVEVEDSLTAGIDTETLANEYSLIDGQLVRHEPIDPTLLPDYIPPMTGGEVFEALVSMLVPDVNVANAIIEPEVAERMTRFYPEWGSGTVYLTGYRVQHEGLLYKCLQDHTSQADWIPTDAPSLWARMLVPDPDVIPDWEQPSSTNPYMKGDKVRHKGQTWVSVIDNNVWEPGVYGWEVVA